MSHQLIVVDQIGSVSIGFSVNETSNLNGRPHIHECRIGQNSMASYDRMDASMTGLYDGLLRERLNPLPSLFLSL